MTRLAWYRTSHEGRRELMREIDAALPWACLIIAVLAVLLKLMGHN